VPAAAPVASTNADTHSPSAKHPSSPRNLALVSRIASPLERGLACTQVDSHSRVRATYVRDRAAPRARSHPRAIERGRVRAAVVMRCKPARTPTANPSGGGQQGRQGSNLRPLVWRPCRRPRRSTTDVYDFGQLCGFAALASPSTRMATSPVSGRLWHGCGTRTRPDRPSCRPTGGASS
jgi:hypothetical protein